LFCAVAVRTEQFYQYNNIIIVITNTTTTLGWENKFADWAH